MKTVNPRKRDTIAARLPPELYEKFSKVCSIAKVDRSSFLKTCVEKLANDNEIFLDNFEKTGSLIKVIKKELADLPKSLVVIKGGNWNKIPETVLYVACDEICSNSKMAWKIFEDTWEKYGLKLEDDEGVQKEFGGGDVLDLSDLGLMALPTEKVNDPWAIIDGQDLWADQLEVRKITLLLAVSEAFVKLSARRVVEETLNYRASICLEKVPMKGHVLEIDSRGRFARSGGTLIVPAGIEHKKDRGNAE